MPKMPEMVPLVWNMPLFGAHCGTNQLKVGEQSESKGGAKSGATSFRRFVRSDLCTGASRASAAVLAQT